MSAKKGQADQVRKKKGKESKPELSLNQKLIKGLDHALRTRILAYMNERPWSPRELEQELGEGLSQVSYHVKVLFDLELIELTGTEPRRGAVEHFYRAIERAFVPSGMATHIPKSAQQIIGNDILEEIDKDVGASLRSGRFYERSDWHTSWTPADLDDQGCKDAEKLADRFIEDFLEIEAESASRRAQCEGDGEHIATSAAVLVFGSEHGEKKKAPSRTPLRKKGSSGS